MLHVNCFFLPKIVRTMNRIVEVGLFPTRSELIRHAILAFLANNPLLMDYLFEVIEKP